MYDEERRSAQRVIGGAVRRFRQRDGLTQAQFAKQVGVSYQYLCGIENGKENFSVAILEKIALALNISPATLLAVAYGESMSFAFGGAAAVAASGAK